MPVVGQASVRIVADARGFARDVERTVNRELGNVDTSGGARQMARRTNRIIENEVTSGFRRAAQTALTAFGTTIQGGISPATAGAFGLIVLAALTPVMAIAGAAAGGALILAFGGAIAAIGIIAAAQSEEVQDAFSSMVSEVGRVIRDLAEPFEDVLVTIASIARQTVGAFQEPLEDAFEEMAPAIESFARQLGRAFTELAPVIGPVTDAFIELLEELGPQLANEVFPDLADAIINLANAVSDNADTITDIITFFLQAAEATINFIAELVRLAGWFADQAPAVQAAIVALGVVIITILAAVLGPIAAVVAAVIGLGIAFLAFRDQFIVLWNEIFAFFEGPVKAAWNAIMDFVGGILDNFLDGVESFVDGVVGAWNGMLDLIEGVIDGIEDAVDDVVSFFSNLSIDFSGIWDGLWNGFRSVINDIISGWNSLSFTVPPIITRFGTFGGFSVGTPNIPFLQEGGIVRSAGTVVVGEAGPELLSLPQGARVDPLIGGDAPGEARFEGELVLDSGELIGFVSGVMSQENSDLRRRVNNGSRRLTAGKFA